MFKRFLLTLALVTLMAGIPVLAQDNGGNQEATPQAAPPMHGHEHGRFDPAKRTEMLTKQLNLTSDQQSKVQDVLKSQQSQMQSLFSDTSVAPEDRRSKMMDIHKASSDQIRALLNSDQQKKWDEMQSRQEQRMEHRGMGKPSTTPPDSSEQK